VLPETAADELELENLDIWDLFSAFNKLLQQIGKLGAVHKVGVDDTPIALHAADITDSIERAGGSQVFEEIFIGRTRAEMIGLFLALLELIRQHRVRATQDRPFGAIVLVLLDSTPLYAVTEPDEVETDDEVDPSPEGEGGAEDEYRDREEGNADEYREGAEGRTDDTDIDAELRS
jgi:chromatin segregation and condensation protein Rec8/ScpA/Scc1 (kleisin family)